MHAIARQFTRSDLDALIALVSRLAAQRWPRMSHLHPGDVVWQFQGAGPKENIRLWHVDELLVGFAWFQPPDTLTFDIDPQVVNVSGIRREMLAWAAERRAAFPPHYPFYLDLQSMDEWRERLLNPQREASASGRYLFASAFDGDPSESAFLEENGFERTEHVEPYLTRDLDTFVAIAPPAGVTVRHVLEGDFEQRVAVHRAAWWPSAGFNLERYLRLRAFAPMFDPELDLVAQDERGEFGCSTIGWMDARSETLFVEPFGTHPQWRGAGVSRAVLSELFVRGRRKGMRHVRIYTAGFNRQAISLYTGCGLSLVDRRRTYRRTAT